MLEVNLLKNKIIYNITYYILHIIYTMKLKNLKKKKQDILNQIYLKYFMQTAGNDNPKIKKEQDALIKQLERLAL